MDFFYHYTLERNISSIKADGPYSGSSFSATEYFDSYEAGQHLGVPPHYIDCVLKFANDGCFTKQQNVSSSNRFAGGGNEYKNNYRPRPIAYRKIRDREWKVL